LVYSYQWKELIEEFYLSSVDVKLEDMDGIILGKFTTYEEAKDTNFERTMGQEENDYYDFRQRTKRQQQHDGDDDDNKSIINNNNQKTTLPSSLSSPSISMRKTMEEVEQPETTVVVSFESIPPPDLVDVAKVYDGPILSVNMFAKKDVPRSKASYEKYQQQCLQSMMSEVNDSEEQRNSSINQKVFMVDSRQYINRMGEECGTDDKHVLGTCHEPPNPSVTIIPSTPSIQTKPTKRYRDPSDMHRCAGRLGGHADLISWDVIEGLFYFDRLGYFSQ
jgi:hypothetical protein